MVMALYSLVVAITLGSLGLWLYMAPNLEFVLFLNNTLAIDFTSMFVLTSIGIISLYLCFHLLKVSILIKLLSLMLVVVGLSGIFKDKLIAHPIYIVAILAALVLCSSLVLLHIHKSQRELIRLGSNLNIAHTFYRPKLDAYMSRLANFNCPEKCSLHGMECFGYVIAIQDFLQIVPILYRYLNNSELDTVNELSQLKTQVAQRDLSNPLNQDYLNLINYILLSKNLLWEFEAKWLQLKSQNERLKSKDYLRKTEDLKRRQHKEQGHYSNDDLDLYRSYEFRESSNINDEEDNDKHSHIDLYGYVDNSNINSEQYLVSEISKNKEQSRRHHAQAQLMQQQIGIRPSLLGEVSLGDDSIRLAESFDFDRAFNTFLRRYSKTLSLRIYAFFQYLAYTHSTKAHSAYHQPRHSKLIRQDLASCILSVNGALYVSSIPLFLEIFKPLFFMIFMSLSTYWMLSGYCLSAFVASVGGFLSAHSLLLGTSSWAISLAMLLVSNTIIALHALFKLPHFDIGYDLLKQVKRLQFIVALLALAISLVALIPGQLGSFIVKTQQDLQQIKSNDLDTTTGYVNPRFFNEHLPFKLAPNIYSVLAVPVIGPRTDNKWVKLYVPAESDFTISPHERLQVSHRKNNKFSLHNKNVPRWRFWHTKNFKLIVDAQKIDSTFVKRKPQHINHIQ